MLLYLLLVACSKTTKDSEHCYYYPYDMECTCATRIVTLNNIIHMTCRPDQTGRVEWEPQSIASRVENEERVGGVFICECK